MNTKDKKLEELLNINQRILFIESLMVKHQNPEGFKKLLEALLKKREELLG